MEESKELNEFYRREIRRMIDKTDDTYSLRSTYTVISTHLGFLAEKRVAELFADDKEKEDT